MGGDLASEGLDPQGGLGHVQVVDRGVGHVPGKQVAELRGQPVHGQPRRPRVPGPSADHGGGQLPAGPHGGQVAVHAAGGLPFVVHEPHLVGAVHGAHEVVQAEVQVVSGQHRPGSGREERVGLALGDLSLGRRAVGHGPPGGQDGPDPVQVAGPEAFQGHLLEVRARGVVVGRAARRPQPQPAARRAIGFGPVDRAPVDAAHAVVGDPPDPEVRPAPVAGEPPGERVAVRPPVQHGAVGGGHHQERVGHLRAHPGGHHLAVDGPLVAGDPAAHAAAVDRGADQLVDEVDGVGLVEAPVCEDGGGQLVVGERLVPALGGQPGTGEAVGQLGPGEGAHGGGRLGGGHRWVALDADERLTEVVLVGLQPVGEPEPVLDGHHEGAAGSEQAGQVAQEPVGVVAGVLQDADAQHNVEAVVVDQVGGAAVSDVHVQPRAAQGRRLGPQGVALDGNHGGALFGRPTAVHAAARPHVQDPDPGSEADGVQQVRSCPPEVVAGRPVVDVGGQLVRAAGAVGGGAQDPGDPVLGPVPPAPVAHRSADRADQVPPRATRPFWWSPPVGSTSKRTRCVWRSRTLRIEWSWRATESS